MDRDAKPEAKEWIGVEDVAEEMGWTFHYAARYVRRIGIGLTRGSTIRRARFRRSEWEKAREADINCQRAEPPPLRTALVDRIIPNKTKEQMARYVKL